MNKVEELEEAHRLARSRPEIDNCLDLVRTRAALVQARRELVVARRPSGFEVALILSLIALSYLLGRMGA